MGGRYGNPWFWGPGFSARGPVEGKGLPGPQKYVK